MKGGGGRNSVREEKTEPGWVWREEIYYIDRWGTNFLAGPKKKKKKMKIYIRGLSPFRKKERGAQHSKERGKGETLYVYMTKGPYKKRHSNPLIPKGKKGEKGEGGRKKAPFTGSLKT